MDSNDQPPNSLSEAMDSNDQPSNKRVECLICQKSLNRPSALYAHLRRIHKVEVEFADRKYKFKCPDPACESVFHLYEKLRNHIEEAHDVKIETCIKQFKTFDEFEKWKEDVQDKLKARYVCRQSRKNPGHLDHYYYICDRSGFYNSVSVGKRKSSSKKINGWCPSGMDVVASGKSVEVKFWMTHFGHSCEVDRLRLSKQERLTIAKKLKEGVSIDKILDDVRDSLVDTDVKRIHLLSRQDISNISQAFKISNKKSLIQKEVTDVSTWVDSLKALGDDDPVIVYKMKGHDHPSLKANEFMLVIFTKVQQQLLQKCPIHIVCIDEINTSHLFNYQLLTLMTIDDFGLGCPMAYCVSNKIDDNIISVFFMSVYQQIGELSTNIFMCPDIPLFYGAWEKIMGPVNIKLLCTWQVDKNWRKTLERLKASEEKKIRVYKAMREIMQEKTAVDFYTKLTSTLEELSEDEEMRYFSNYLQIKYATTSTEWAYCYRSQQLQQHTMTLEQMHRSLKECYSEGKSINSFVRALNLIMGFSRDKLLEKLEKLPKEYQVDKLGRDYHSCAQVQKIDVVKTNEDLTDQLQVPTIEDENYYVEHNIDKVCPPACKPVCSACKICYHRFTCTCIENFINLNVCRHILASIDLMKDKCVHFQNGMLQDARIVLQDADVPVSREEIVVQCGDKPVGPVISWDETELALAVERIQDDDRQSDTNSVMSEDYQSSLVQKAEYVLDVFRNRMFAPEEYQSLEQRFNEIIDFINEKAEDV